MESLKDMGLKRIGVGEWQRIERWVRWADDTYGKCADRRDRIIKPLLALNGQQIEPDTALLIVGWFGLEIDSVPCVDYSIADPHGCEFLSCKMEERWRLRVHYDGENRRLYIAETDNPRTTFEGIRKTLEYEPTDENENSLRGRTVHASEGIDKGL